MKLGVNIDHVATLRNARGGTQPDPVAAALAAEQAGADNITCHLREDRRHIRDADVRRLRARISVPLNLEMAATEEMLAIAVEVKPHTVTIVPEGRQELTTEGGYRRFDAALQRTVACLREHSIAVALFVDPELDAIEKAHRAGVTAVELHVGDICAALQRDSRTPRTTLRSADAAMQAAVAAGLEVHIGHGIDYHTAPYFQLLAKVSEADIGHAIIAEALSVGITSAVRRMKELLNDAQHFPHD